jgi:hypothetical protein
MIGTGGTALTERWTGARNIAFSHNGRDQNGHETDRESSHEPPPIHRLDDERPASAFVPPLGHHGGNTGAGSGAHLARRLRLGDRSRTGEVSEIRLPIG